MIRAIRVSPLKASVMGARARPVFCAVSEIRHRVTKEAEELDSYCPTLR
jgi:hypothetical protein